MSIIKKGSQTPPCMWVKYEMSLPYLNFLTKYVLLVKVMQYYS
jgi:hypothetical protein